MVSRVPAADAGTRRWKAGGRAVGLWGLNDCEYFQELQIVLFYFYISYVTYTFREPLVVVA